MELEAHDAGVLKLIHVTYGRINEHPHQAGPVIENVANPNAVQAEILFGDPAQGGDEPVDAFSIVFWNRLVHTPDHAANGQGNIDSLTVSCGLNQAA
jgi:hypothetical protein